MMTPDSIEGAQAELGRAQGFVPLQIRYEMVHDSGTDKDYVSMVCQLRPSADDIARIVAGEPLQLRILGIDWPPVDIVVGRAEYDKASADAAFAVVRGIQKARREEQIKEATAARIAAMKDSLANLNKKG